MNESGDLRPAAVTLTAVAILALAACVEGDAPDAAAGASPGDPPGAATTADLSAAAAEARTAIEAYVAAINAMDIDSAGSFYSNTPDFQWIEDGAVRYRSARESHESLAALVEMASSTELTVSDLSVTALSLDIAVATCHFVQAIAVEGGPGFAFAGALTFVLRRENGRWLFVSGHTSSARPRPEGAAIEEPGGRS
ncbi:MAG: nuclear transport factor 2 family protein [Gemmatimonadetes bacterium]|nr:nuclear transport factor 2 family protein [Gemmatimonadota bacterium]